MSETPMMRQYRNIKEQHKDCILFYRLGDFYEMFSDDAIEASKILNITLTSRNKGKETEVAMCGVPFHAAEGYIAKLTAQGKRVAICEQTSDPNAKGIVEREVVRIVTPGTTLDESLLDSNAHNFLVGVDVSKDTYGLARVDLTTGEFAVTETGSVDDFLSELRSLEPAEIVMRRDAGKETALTPSIADISTIREIQPEGFASPKEDIESFFSVNSLDSFGIQDMHAAVRAAALCLRYLQETQKTVISHLTGIQRYSLADVMILDASTVRNLELFYNNHDFSTRGSLISCIDKTQTGMGGRLLRSFLSHPLKEKNAITQRHDAVQTFYDSYDLREGIAAGLNACGDVERLLGRIGCNRCSAKDLNGLRISLQQVPRLKALISEHSALKPLADNLIELGDLVRLLSDSIVEEPSGSMQILNVIKDGYDAELDELRTVMRSGKERLAEIQRREQERTSISSLKVKFNKVFGYYIEVSKANASLVPSDYERKQTLVNAERYVTLELKEYEQKVLSAEENIRAIEARIFEEVRQKVLTHATEIKQIGNALAHLDVFLSFAELALAHDYHRPQINESYDIEIRAGRHPVIEQLQKAPYISNDGRFNTKDHQLILLTGPNMSGKSSYLRQTALIVLLAQIGSFVPAQQASIGVVDRIFTRVGASDNLSGGQSTFMVEMQEAANILHNATGRSLIILDELGRGTSTYDGISIAWAIVSYIHDHIKAKTIFATHYHELIHLAQELDYAQNYSIAVKEENGEVVFLRKIIQGGVDKSYGIEVAKLAGLPKEIIEKATHVMSGLESQQKTMPHSQESQQDSLFGAESALVQELQSIDPDSLTPIEALKTLDQIIKKVKS